TSLEAREERALNEIGSLRVRLVNEEPIHRVEIALEELVPRVGGPFCPPIEELEVRQRRTGDHEITNGIALPQSTPWSDHRPRNRFGIDVAGIALSPQSLRYAD